MTKAVAKTYEYIKTICNDNSMHGITHAVRVKNWAIKIAKSENYPDLELVELVALLHDVGLTKSNKRMEHAKLGADMASDFLSKNKLLPRQKITLIHETIKNHSNNVKDGNELLRILRDADMLDMLGAVGIMRTFVSQRKRLPYDSKCIKGELWESTYEEAYHKYNPETGAGNSIVDQLNFQMHCQEEFSTEYAKEIAKELCVYMSDFILQLEKEITFK